ncbi:hypothetical protein DYBT9623_01829 [Dyadobacter sp. CECT 9623]|uniref:Carboxypeptidase regulatory-like domain-containing protein n=2 Tax=Dyadobacter linearis TaxID=2823330 RepID=A0ABM8UNQ1_9BACT|nr:hypothetical protein DYBT9623_01829 [Dyadobacter sp. CECT 9623]
MATVVTQACTSNYNHVIVSGRVRNGLTGLPLQNADVLIFCRQESGIDDMSLVEQSVRTDSAGYFVAEFNKGVKFEIAIKKKGFVPVKLSRWLDSNTIKLNISLLEIAFNSSTIASFDINECRNIQIYNRYLTKHKSTSPIPAVNLFGLDIATLCVKDDTSKCDIWLEANSNFEHPLRIISKYGVHPIYRSEVKSSLLYERCVAPTSGYKYNLTLEPEIVGFFVKCSKGNSYAKVLLEFEETTGEWDENETKIAEKGISLNYLFQPNGTTNLHYTNDSLDLDFFLRRQY